MNYVEVSSPLRGAAYQVLYELVWPAHCSSRERQTEIKAELARVVAWTQGQSSETADAYQWAADSIADNVEKRLQQTELGNQVAAAFASIPKPPER